MSPAFDTVNVTLGKRGYSIHIGPALLSQAGTLLERILADTSHIIILYDEALQTSHLPVLSQALSTTGKPCATIAIPSGEGSKCFRQLESLCNALLALHPNRKTLVIAMGGGVTGDLAGFTASILLRGVPFVQVPTTLLSQVDSSVGGKTGINMPQGKNLIGTFYQPQAVLIDTDTLATLPKRQLLAGYAEIVKYGLIDDPDFFCWLETHGQALLNGDTALLRQAIATSCEAKARVVSADEREQGNRALLNLGHTFGHALETACGHSDDLLHGEAVAIGMVMAFHFSASLSLCDEQDAERIARHLETVGLPVSPRDIHPDWSVEDLLNTMRHDKKNHDHHITFILARGIGKAFIKRDVPEDAVLSFLNSQCHA